MDQFVRRARRAQRIVEAHIYDESMPAFPIGGRAPATPGRSTWTVVRGHIDDHFWELIDTYVAAKK